MSYQIKKITYKADGKAEVIFIDKTKMRVSHNTALEMNLGSDMVLSNEQYQQLESLNHVDKCRKKLLDYLSRRPHGRVELKRKLLKSREYSVDLVEGLLNKAEEQGLINDEDFARLFVDDSMRLRPQDGPGKIRSRLFQKGLSRQIIDQVMSEFAEDPEEEFEKLKSLATKKWRTYKSNLELHKRKARLYRFLISRGFSSQMVGKVVSELTRQTGEF